MTTPTLSFHLLRAAPHPLIAGEVALYKMMYEDTGRHSFLVAEVDEGGGIKPLANFRAGKDDLTEDQAVKAAHLRFELEAARFWNDYMKKRASQLRNANMTDDRLKELMGL